MNRLFTQALSAAVAVLAFAGVARAQPPSGDDVLRGAREASQRQQARLRAQLRDDDGNKTPFMISAAEGTVNYDFENPPQRIQLVIGDDRAELREGVGKATRAVQPARYDESVRGLPLTYEDLALAPLYWPRAKLLGEETVKTRKCWQIEVPAPAGKSQYGVARLWIDQATSGAVKIEVYGKDGRKRREFFATSVQTINGKWTLKTMRIQNYDPATHRRAELMYLDILDEAS